MVIIYDTGNFWIESIQTPVVAIPAAAGETISASIVLERPGHFVGSAVHLRQGTGADTRRGIGTVQVGNGNPISSLSFGDQVFEVVTITNKIATGSGGNFTYFIILFMRL